MVLLWKEKHFFQAIKSSSLQKSKLSTILDRRCLPRHRQLPHRRYLAACQSRKTQQPLQQRLRQLPAWESVRPSSSSRFRCNWRSSSKVQAEELLLSTRPSSTRNRCSRSSYISSSCTNSKQRLQQPTSNSNSSSRLLLSLSRCSRRMPFITSPKLETDFPLNRKHTGPIFFAV